MVFNATVPTLSTHTSPVHSLHADVYKTIVMLSLSVIPSLLIVSSYVPRSDIIRGHLTCEASINLPAYVTVVCKKKVFKYKMVNMGLNNRQIVIKIGQIS